MSKKPNAWTKTETFSYVKVVILGLLFSILVVNCNSGDSPDKDEKKDTVSYSTPTSTPEQPSVMVNWLAHWDTIPFIASPTDSLSIRQEMKIIRAYVRGWLIEYNDSIKATAQNQGARSDYVVDKFEFNILSRRPLKYKVKAFLNPPARTSAHSHEESEEEGPGGHLIPPPPPPPGKGG